MVDPELWALMQRVETRRYRAERLEAISAGWSEENNALASDIAGQWRQLAEQIYALSTGAEIPEVEALRWLRVHKALSDEGLPADPIEERLRDLERRSRPLLRGGALD
jgi:hypothetical protein